MKSKAQPKRVVGQKRILKRCGLYRYVVALSYYNLQKFTFAVFAFVITNIYNKICHFFMKKLFFDVNTLKFRDETGFLFFFCVRNGNIRCQIFLIYYTLQFMILKLFKH